MRRQPAIKRGEVQSARAPETSKMHLPNTPKFITYLTYINLKLLIQESYLQKHKNKNICLETVQPRNLEEKPRERTSHRKATN